MGLHLHFHLLTLVFWKLVYCDALNEFGDQIDGAIILEITDKFRNGYIRLFGNKSEVVGLVLYPLFTKTGYNNPALDGMELSLERAKTTLNKNIADFKIFAFNSNKNTTFFTPFVQHPPYGIYYLSLFAIGIKEFLRYLRIDFERAVNVFWYRLSVNIHFIIYILYGSNIGASGSKSHIECGLADEKDGKGRPPVNINRLVFGIASRDADANYSQ